MAAVYGTISDNKKLVGWCLVGLILAVLVATSIPDRGIREGHRGTYLGSPTKQRDIAADRVQALTARTAGQHY